MRESLLVHDRWMEAMQAGDLERAWSETDRIEIPRREVERSGRFVWQPHHLLWNGEPFSNRRVLVRCNHGLGDTLQFARFIPRVAAVARCVTVMAQPPLVRMLRGIPGFGDVRDGWRDEPPEYDGEIEIMELAYAFRITAQMLPAAVSYLPREHVCTLAQHVPVGPAGAALRVGLVWAASGWDESRLIPVAAFAPLSCIEGVEFFSLQQGTP